MSDSPLVIEYYSDALCIWAWIAQRRVDELIASTGSEIRLEYRYLDLFGDARTRIEQQWAQRGLYEGFCEHVCDVAAPYVQQPVNPQVWRSVRPATSGNAHLVIKAVERQEGPDAAAAFALRVRKAFFLHAQDIASLGLLLSLAEEQGLPRARLQESLDDGSAMAALSADYQRARSQGIKGSPSWVIDEGRQTLYGNIGYRVLHANIAELLKHPADEASWC